MVRLLLPIPAADSISVGSPKLLPFPSFPPSPPLIVILAVTNTFLSNHVTLRDNFLSGFHGYGKLSLLIADNTVMYGGIKAGCLMICTNHLCCCSRMTSDLTLCVHVYSLFGLCTVILSSGW